MGQEIADLAQRAHAEGSTGQVIGFIDDDPVLHGSEILGLPVLGGSAWLRDHDAVVAVALGSTAVRARVVDTLTSWGVRAARSGPPRRVRGDRDAPG